MSNGFELDEMKEIIDSFVVEVAEHIDNLDRSLVELEENPSDLDLLNKIFRAAHTIKGAASFLDFDVMAKVTHHAESVLDALRKDKLKVNSDIMDVILEAVDVIKVIFNVIRETYQEDKSLVITNIINKLEGILKQTEEPGSATEKKIAPRPIVQTTAAPPAQIVEKPSEVSSETKTTAVSQTVASDVSMASSSTPTDDSAQGIQEETKETKTRPPVLEKRSIEQVQTIRVDLHRLDSVLNLVQELVPGRNRLLQVNKIFKDRLTETYRQYEDFYQKNSEMTNEDKRTRKRFSNEINDLSEIYDEITAQIDLITTELQMAVMKTRMLPISNVFNKFPRMVRDLSRECGKDIKLEIEGKDTELDKSVIEIIGDPLMHCIRNSVDHGIELPNAREAKGKPRQGTIFLNAYHEGNYIVVQVIDDGKGLDIERIKQKAVEKGIYTLDEINVLGEKDLTGLIFHPGFSTAEKITNVSGRGVGMDVLRSNIERLNGLIDVETAVDEGTRVSIKIPLTLAIIQALLVTVDIDIFAIPLGSVVETVRIRKADIKTVKNHQVYRLRDIILPLLSLAEVFELPSEKKENDDYIYVVVLGIADKRIGLVVDSLLGQEEVVIKPLGDFFDDTPGIAGATIMGDGRVRLIVNVSDLVDVAERKH